MVIQPGDVASVGAVANPAGSPRVVGLDLSLTSTGIATPEDGAVRYQTVMKGVLRLQMIREAVMNFVLYPPADLVVVEHYMAFRGPAIAIVEVHGVIKLSMFDSGISFAVVQPALLKKFATGKGGGPDTGKDAMIAAAIHRFGYKGQSNDEADAWLLRCMGLAHCELDLPGDQKVTAPMRDALDRVQWPLG